MTDDTPQDDVTPEADVAADETSTNVVEPTADAPEPAATEATEAAADDAPATTEATEAKPKPKPRARKPKAADASEGAVAEPVVAAPTPEEQAVAARAAARERGEVEDRSVRAVAKYLRFSAQKGRLVVDQVRGKAVVEAATTLTFSTRGASREVLKVLKSVVANAENNFGMNAEELYVESAFVDEGPTFKRFKPRARGRVDRINKRTCHVTLVVNNAPTALLEGRRGASAGGSRSARVAASRGTSKGSK